MSTEIVAAIVGAVGAVLAAGVAALLGSRKRSKEGRPQGDVQAMSSEPKDNEIANLPALELGIDGRPQWQFFKPLEEGIDSPGAGIAVTVESAHTGESYTASFSPRVNISSLLAWAERSLQVRRTADTGAFTPFMVRWVLVDRKARELWDSLARRKQRELVALIMGKDTVLMTSTQYVSLEDAGVYDGIVFRLCSIEDTAAPSSDAAMTASGYPG